MESARPQLGHFVVNRLGCCAQTRHIHPLTDRWQVTQTGQPAPKQLERARPIALFNLEKRHTHLQDALIQIAHRPRLRHPRVLKAFVLLKKLPSVKLRHPGARLIAQPIVPALGIARGRAQMTVYHGDQLLHHAAARPSMVRAGAPRRGQRGRIHMAAKGIEGDQPRMRAQLAAADGSFPVARRLQVHQDQDGEVSVHRVHQRGGCLHQDWRAPLLPDHIFHARRQHQVRGQRHDGQGEYGSDRVSHGIALLTGRSAARPITQWMAASHSTSFGPGSGILTPKIQQISVGVAVVGRATWGYADSPP